MRFDLTDEQDALSDVIRDLLEKELDSTRRMRVFEGGDDFDRELWAQLIECGVGGVLVPEELGGSGLGLLEAALVAEQVGAAAAPVPLWGHVLATLAIVVGGTPEQQQRWLPALASGEVLATVALGHQRGCWFPSEWDGSPSEQISATRYHVPNGCSADLLVVGVGGGLVLVTPQADEVVAVDQPAADRTRKLATVTFTDAAAEPLGPDATDAVIRAGLVLLAADAFGGSLACLERSTDYTKSRVQYGVPVATFQAVKHQLADLAVDIEQSRALYWYAAHAHDVGAPDRDRSALLAKAHLADTYVRVTRGAVELHGGIGFTWEYDLHLWVRRALHDRAFLGDPIGLRRRLADSSDWAAAGGSVI